jgi:hypothetical protein
MASQYDLAAYWKQATASGSGRVPPREAANAKPGTKPPAQNKKSGRAPSTRAPSSPDRWPGPAVRPGLHHREAEMRRKGSSLPWLSPLSADPVGGRPARAPPPASRGPAFRG